MTIKKIPLEATPQKFTIILNKNTYNFLYKWNISQGWILDIFDKNDVLLLANIPFATGRPLTEAFKYLNFDGDLVVYTDNSDLPPTLANLAIGSNLFFLSDF